MSPSPWKNPKPLECKTCHWKFGTPEALQTHRTRGHQLRACPCGTKRIKYVTQKLIGMGPKTQQHTEYRCPGCGSVAMSKRLKRQT